MIFNLNELLCRSPIQVDLRDSLKYIKNKRVLITGAGGSIGSELCRQMLFAGAKRLFLFGHGEDSIYRTINELVLMQKQGHGEKTNLIPVIGELQDKNFIQFLLERLRVDVIFHTAAHKHVPMMEANPVEAIKNNVFGTLNLVNAIKNTGIGKFIFISTDKAVNPICIYGVSKALSERIILGAAKEHPSFLAVRFGNVIGSKGSVIPLWIDQIKSGGPITITHPQVKRFFMSIQEAVSLVIKIGGNGKGGGLYILDMGEQILIQDIVSRLVRQAGLELDKDIKIEYTGLRPGEKLEETLYNKETETTSETEMPRIFSITKNEEIMDVDFDECIQALAPICYYNEILSDKFRDRKLLRNALKKVFPTLGVPRNVTRY